MTLQQILYKVCSFHTDEKEIEIKHVTSVFFFKLGCRTLNTLAVGGDIYPQQRNKNYFFSSVV